MTSPPATASDCPFIAPDDKSVLIALLSQMKHRLNEPNEK